MFQKAHSFKIDFRFRQEIILGDFFHSFDETNMNVIPSVKGVRQDFDEPGVSYANFKHEQFSYLNITRIDSKLVQKDIECGLACLEVTSCSSFNLATFPDINGKLLCELLPSDKHRMPNELIHNPMFDHFSKTVSVV